jgi:hypothetical protein
MPAACSRAPVSCVRCAALPRHLPRAAYFQRELTFVRLFVQLVACALARVRAASSARSSGGGASASGGGGAGGKHDSDSGAGLALRGDDVDLNHLCALCCARVRGAAHSLLMSDAELAKYKALMEEDFRKNQLMPGDEGYEYDKQVGMHNTAGACCSCVHVSPRRVRD